MDEKGANIQLPISIVEGLHDADPESIPDPEDVEIRKAFRELIAQVVKTNRRMASSIPWMARASTRAIRTKSGSRRASRAASIFLAISSADTSRLPSK
jgi:hypothetical protein